MLGADCADSVPPGLAAARRLDCAAEHTRTAAQRQLTAPAPRRLQIGAAQRHNSSAQGAATRAGEMLGCLWQVLDR